MILKPARVFVLYQPFPIVHLRANMRVSFRNARVAPSFAQIAFELRKGERNLYSQDTCPSEALMNIKA